MRLLIRSATIIDSQSPFHHQTKDLFIENGTINRISDAASIPLSDADTVIQSGNLHVSAGWVDMRVSAQDPGYEHREDLYSVREAAAFGGFTEIAVLPNTKPAVQTKEAVTYLKSKGNDHAVRIHPMAAISVDIAGKDLTEMIDLHTAGAIAFTDGHKPVWHSDIFVKTLQYLQTFDGLLINRPEDQLLTQFGNMHEGIASTQLGLKGMPALAEEMMIARDLRFLEYAGGKLHFSAISTSVAVELIRQAKRQGLSITCDIAAHQIAFMDEDLSQFDTNLKVNPPFRSRQDIDALWQGLLDGTIDAIVSDHHPLDEESKKLEFDLADFGILGLETAFAVVHTHNQRLSVDSLVDKFTAQPRRILQLPAVHIMEGQLANLTLFDPDLKWTFSEKDIRSKSRNTPFIGSTFRGKALAIVNNGKLSSAGEKR